MTSSKKERRYTQEIETPLGKMLAVANEHGICSLDFLEEDDEEIQNLNHPLLRILQEQLDAYFAKKIRNFTLPLFLEGTPFQKSVWETLRKIEYAQTLSYAQEAKMLGHPKAVRAVANANGKNPIAIIIPCHRVIASDKTIGGYSAGVWRKEFLLSLEREAIFSA